MVRFLIVLLFFGFTSTSVLSQIFYNHIVDSTYANIKSVQLRPATYEYTDPYSINIGPNSEDSLSFSVIPLNGNKALQLEFDIIEDDILRNLQYRIIHCDRFWRRSNLLENEYLQAMNDDFIFDGDAVENSFNTSVSYTHYCKYFPFQSTKIFLSGNYIVQVYDYNEEGDEKILIQRRFIITEQLVGIDATVTRPSLVQHMDDSQQISMKIDPQGFDMSSFDKDLYVVYMQNGRWDKTITGIQPNHVMGDGTLVFNDTRNALFSAGNEFRQFHFKNIRVATFPVDYIGKTNNTYSVFLHPDDDWHSAYTSRSDLNGKFFIYEDVTPNQSEITADYANVQISLPYHRNYFDTLNVYVFGEYNDWKLNNENKMTYNEDRQQYETTLFLKQGYYSYKYVLASDDFKVIDDTYMDGSFYQTENEYDIFIYYYDYNLGYDRCIGHKKITYKQY